MNQTVDFSELVNEVDELFNSDLGVAEVSLIRRVLLNKVLLWSAIITVLITGTVSFISSYFPLVAVAQLFGVAIPAIFPIMIDGVMIAASFAIFLDSARGRSGILPKITLYLAIIASIYFNVIHVSVDTKTFNIVIKSYNHVLVALVAPVMYAGSVEILSQIFHNEFIKEALKGAQSTQNLISTVFARWTELKEKLIPELDKLQSRIKELNADESRLEVTLEDLNAALDKSVNSFTIYAKYLDSFASESYGKTYKSYREYAMNVIRMIKRGETITEQRLEVLGRNAREFLASIKADTDGFYFVVDAGGLQVRSTKNTAVHPLLFAPIYAREERS